MTQRRIAFLCSLVILGLACSTAPWSGPSTGGPAGEPIPFTYRTVGDRALPAYVFAPAGREIRRAAILLFHGGGWHAGDATWVFPAARRFADLGLVAIAIEYRLSDEQTTPLDAFEDTCAAFAWAREHAHELGFDPRRVGAYGVSAGGHLVAAAATIGCGNPGGLYGMGGPDSLVLWSPAVDVANSGWFNRLLQGRGRAVDYSPVDQLGPALPATSIVQGEADTLTPLAGAQRFCAGVRAAGSPCDLEVFPGVGHLLTRNLANQEDDYDPDPVARAEGWKRQNAFLVKLWGRRLRLPRKDMP